MMNEVKKTLNLLLAAVALAAAALATSACSSSDRILAEYEGTSLSVPEYEQMFLRTRTSPPHNEEEKEQFLTVLMNYKLKLREAQGQSLQLDPEYRRERQKYRDQLAVNYLYKQELIEPGTKTLYERRKMDIEVQHILVRWISDAEGNADTLATWSRAQKILKLVHESGQPFDSLVWRYSDEGGTAESLGLLDWFFAGTTLPRIDDMMYAAKIGDIAPQTVRTGMGYHVLSLHDKRKARHRVRAAQILYRLDIDNPDDTAAAFAHLSLVLDSLHRGLATFEELARRNSQDTLSGKKGGDLDWMNRGTTLEKLFEAHLFNLKVGEVSSVVRTPLGMHIVKMLDEEEPLPYEKQRPNLRSIYVKERFAMDFISYMSRLRNEYGFGINSNVVELMIARTDSTMTTSTPGWDRKFVPRDREAYLIRLKTGSVTVGKVIDFVKSEPSLQMRPFTVSTLDTIAYVVGDHYITMAETMGFEEKYPDFRRLLKEYEESSLIMLVEQKEVWSKIDIPDSAAIAYWERHRADFKWPPRVEIAEIYMYTKKLSLAYIDSLNAGLDFSYLAGRYTQRPGYLKQNGSWGYIPESLNELSMAAANMEIGEVSEPIKFQSGFSLIEVTGKDPAREQTFEEARTTVLTVMREQIKDGLMVEWTDSLWRKYGVVLYRDRLVNAFRQQAQTEPN